jgi:hypothetical protein
MLAREVRAITRAREEIGTEVDPQFPLGMPLYGLSADAVSAFIGSKCGSTAKS